MSSLIQPPAAPTVPKVVVPTIGRMVWFWPSKQYREYEGAQAYSAQVCYVHNERMVNIAGYDPNGAPFQMTSVRLRQPEDPYPEQGPFVEWMPYQIATAPK